MPFLSSFLLQFSRHVKSLQKYWQQLLSPAALPVSAPTAAPASPHTALTRLIDQHLQAGATCGARTSGYLPHLPLSGSRDRVPRRRGRIVWDVANSQGTAPAPKGTFPWMASLFVLFR